MRKYSLIISEYDPSELKHLAALRLAKQDSETLAFAFYTRNSTNTEEAVESLRNYLHLESNIDVDRIVPYSTEIDLHNILHNYPYNTLYLSDVYKDSTFSGKDICESKGIDIQYLDINIFKYHVGDSKPWSSMIDK